MSARARAQAAFASAFDGAPAVVAIAPGRVNLIGEHTDYNDGFVLPVALREGTVVAARANGSREVRVFAADFAAQTAFALDGPLVRDPAQPWADYVKGVVAILREGESLVGMDLAIAGDVPKGAGLSSSASLEVAVAGAALALAGVERSATEIALLAQRAEREFVGMNCGVMDQMAAAHAAVGSALLIDCRSLEATPVALPPGSALLIVHSGVERGLVDGRYNRRRAQCEAAAAHCGVAALRDLTPERLAAGPGALDETAFRRARHIVTENARVLAAAQALAAGDLAALAPLMAQSHASMRDDFEITTPEVDRLADLLQQALAGEGGARMTGGGFGGAVVALGSRAAVARAREAVLARYLTPAGAPPLVSLTEV